MRAQRWCCSGSQTAILAPRSNQKAQPFRAGPSSVVVDAQERVAIGSRALHQEVADGPELVGYSGLHCWRDAQRLVNANEVVPRKVQAVSGPQVLPLLAERIRQPR